MNMCEFLLRVCIIQIKVVNAQNLVTTISDWL